MTTNYQLDGMKSQGMVQFPGMINSSGGEVITTITQEKLRGGKLSQGKLCGESWLEDVTFS